MIHAAPYCCAVSRDIVMTAPWHPVILLVVPMGPAINPHTALWRPLSAADDAFCDETASALAPAIDRSADMCKGSRYGGYHRFRGTNGRLLVGTGGNGSFTRGLHRSCARPAPCAHPHPQKHTEARFVRIRTCVCTRPHARKDSTQRFPTACGPDLPKEISEF